MIDDVDVILRNAPGSKALTDVLVLKIELEAEKRDIEVLEPATARLRGVAFDQINQGRLECQDQIHKDTWRLRVRGRGIWHKESGTRHTLSWHQVSGERSLR